MEWLDDQHAEDSYPENPLSYYFIDNIYPLGYENLRWDEVACWVDSYIWTDLELHPSWSRSGSDEYYADWDWNGVLCFGVEGYSFHTISEDTRGLSRTERIEDCLLSIRAPQEEDAQEGATPEGEVGV